MTATPRASGVRGAPGVRLRGEVHDVRAVPCSSSSWLSLCWAMFSIIRYIRFIIDLYFRIRDGDLECAVSPVRRLSAAPARRAAAARRARRLALGRAAREGAARGCDTWPRGVIKTLHYELRRLILRSFIC